MPPTPFSTVSILTPLLMYPPNKALEILKIVNGPIKVIVNGLEKNLVKHNILNASHVPSEAWELEAPKVDLTL